MPADITDPRLVDVFTDDPEFCGGGGELERPLEFPPVKTTRG
jgi:hypothetical protein